MEGTLKKINKAVSNIYALGGTLVTFNAPFVSAFEPRGNVKYQVVKIEYNKLTAVNVHDEDDFISMPLEWFSESYLRMLWTTFKKECKKQLTENAYKKVITEE